MKIALETLSGFFPHFILIDFSIVILAVNGAQNMESQSEQGFWQYLVNIFSAADAFRCLLWASMVSGVVSLAVHTLILKERLSLVFQHFMDGCRAMFIVCVILVLAWSIGDVCQRLKTEVYVAFSGRWIQSIVSAVIYLLIAAGSVLQREPAFTMSILIPITVPLTLQYGEHNVDILLGTVGSVLGGAIFGDHCSPLSDTTILSSGARMFGLRSCEHHRSTLCWWEWFQSFACC